MKFTKDWLNEYVDTTNLTSAELSDHLTMLGLEVDSVTKLFPELSNIQTALVTSVTQHPDADRLSLCTVSVGDDELQIVCGASNVREGLITAIALPGTKMPNGTKIKKSKVRGVKSFGMLCSESELGLSDSSSGIIELPQNCKHGISILEALGINDELIEVDLTPNRPDCASVIGTAREIAGITNKKLIIPSKNNPIDTKCQDFSVDVQSQELCPRYAARLIKGVKIGPSPWWLRKRLLAVGIRPINNVVDITNFVMLEYGQPLHAFDFSKISGKEVIIRTPRKNEKTFTTLDNIERQIDHDMLMICDTDKPIAIAGVMGGFNSEVSSETTNILLESACFNPISVRKTARKLNISTDASYRFERGVDPGGVTRAMERAISLIYEIAGGKIITGGSDIYSGKRPINSQTLRISRTSNLLGVELTKEYVTELLESIDLTCKEKDDDTLWIKVPTFRIDIEREADLVEEVARLIGYNNIPTSLPTVSLSYPNQDKSRAIKSNIRTALTSLGFYEAINYSFCSPKHIKMLGLTEDDIRYKQVKLLNPLSEEQAVMRTTLIPGLLENIKRNLNFQNTAVKLFEIGKVFFPTEDDKQPLEKTRLAAVVTGNRHGASSSLHYKKESFDILDLKGSIEHLLTELRLYNFKESPIKLEPIKEKYCENYLNADETMLIKSGSDIIGYIGKLKQSTVKNFSIKQDVYCIDLDFDTICSLPPVKKKFKQLHVYPAVSRDISLVVENNIPAGNLLAEINKHKEKLLESSRIFDIYKGEAIQEGYKSVSISVTYRSQTKTLTEKNVEKAHNKLVKNLTKKFDASFRAQ